MEKQTKTILIVIVAVAILAYIFKDDLKKWLKKDKKTHTGTAGSTGTSGNTGSTGTGSTGSTGTGSTGSTGTGSTGTGSTGSTGSTGTSGNTGSTGTGTGSTGTKTTAELINDFYNAFEVTEKEQDANRAIKEVDALNNENLAKFAIEFYDTYKKNALKITGITNTFGCGYSSETCNTIRKVRDRLKTLQSNNAYNPKKYVDAFLL